MGTVLGCIADDFTGATDLAGILARSGFGVSLRIGVPKQDDPSPSPFEVVALKCRTAPIAEAVAESAAALAWLERAGARRFFWKYCSTFDSTARGNIGPVAEALMRTLGTVQTIYCPAFPENSRTVYMGRLFVGDIPLDESPMKDHPLTPMRDSSLKRLLEPQVRGRVGTIYWRDIALGAERIREKLTTLAEQGVQHVVVDCIQPSDLTQLAQACWNMDLLTGGSALAIGLPEMYRRHGEIGDATQLSMTPHVAPGVLLLSGSCSAMTRAQVAYFAREEPALKLDPIALGQNFEVCVTEACRWIDQLQLAAPKLIYSSAEPDEVARVQQRIGRERAGNLVEQALARLAQHGLKRGVRRLIVAGGESSGAVTKALDLNRLDIGLEIAPGVPWTYAECDGEPLALALKSGNFGEETFFQDALTLLS